jgi:hypothetical protein
MAGYLGAIPVPQATQHRESFTATSGQTTFNTAGYTVGFLDVYLNGSHLSPADFTATNGSDVVLASGASTGDVCDIISYTAFEVADQTFTGTTTMDVAAITGVLTTTAATVFNGGFAANGACTITTADNLSGLIVASTDADAGVGPTVQLFRNSSSPADNDLAGNLLFVAENDASEATVYANLGAHLQDVTNGTEDGKFFINTMVAGAEKSRLFMPSTETVFNEESIDLDFRVESNGNANMLFVDGGNDRVGIGTSSVTQKLDIEASAVNTGILLYNTNTTSGASVPIFLASESGGSTTNVSIDNTGSGHLSFRTGATTKNSFGTERMRIDSSGRVGIGAVPTAQFAHSILQVGSQATLGANATLSTTGQT